MLTNRHFCVICGYQNITLILNTNPGKSFGFLFIPNQSDLIRNPNSFELIRTHPSCSEKSFQSRLMQIGRKSIRLNPRLWIRMNPDQFLDPYEFEVGIIRMENSVSIILTWDWFGLRTSFGFIRIGNLGLSRIEFRLGLKISDWDELIFHLIISNEIENFFWIDSDEFGLARIQISEWIGISLIGSEWISVWNFYQGKQPNTLIKFGFNSQIPSKVYLFSNGTHTEEAKCVFSVLQ